MGLMVIDQSAVNIAPSVITNTNTKLVFRQEDGTEIETIGKAIGLDDKTWGDLQLLGTGECLLRNEKFTQPIKIAPLAKDEMLVEGNVDRDKFFDPSTQWTPSYKDMQSLLRDYCNSGALRKDKKGQLWFDGYTSDKYKQYEKKLIAMCNGHDDLRRYAQIKTLIELRRYATAESELGIQEGGSAHGN